MKLGGKSSMRIEELKQLYEMAKQLGSGKDPSTNLAFSEDTILNSQIIRKYNNKVAEILCGIIRTSEQAKQGQNIDLKNRKLQFHLNDEAKKSFKFSKTPISISALVYSLNGISESYMKKLRATDITNWLLSQGYLEQREMENGNKYKVATSRGNELGIVNEQHQNSYGNIYSVNLYDENAQKFVVDNLDNILRKE